MSSSESCLGLRINSTRLLGETHILILKQWRDQNGCPSSPDWPSNHSFLSFLSTSSRRVEAMCRNVELKMPLAFLPSGGGGQRGLESGLKLFSNSQP